MSQDGEPAASPAVPAAGEGGGEEHVASVAAWASDEDLRVPVEERKTWWFRTYIAVFAALDLSVAVAAARAFLKDDWAAGGIGLWFAVAYGMSLWRRARGYERKYFVWLRLAFAVVFAAVAVVAGLRHAWLALALAVVMALWVGFKWLEAVDAGVPPDHPDS